MPPIPVSKPAAEQVRKTPAPAAASAPPLAGGAPVPAPVPTQELVPIQAPVPTLAPLPAQAPAAATTATPADGSLPLEAAPELPANPQPARGALLTPGPTDTPPPSQVDASQGPSGGTAQLSGTPRTQTVALQKAPRSDPAVGTASMKLPLAGLNAAEMAIDRNWKTAGRAAARVGDEVITLHDLVLTVRDQLGRHPPQRELSRFELNMVAKSVLAGLIERTLICQEAKRVLKNPKQLDSLYQASDKFWRETELPPLLRRHSVESELQLAQKFTESGRSLESMRHSFRQEFLAQVYLDQKLRDHRKVGLPEMLEYYSEHYRDKEYFRPAQITCVRS